MLKRTPFKKKTYKEAIAHQATKKRTMGLIRSHKGIKKPKKNPVKRLKVQLWELCRKIQFLKYGDICYTCNKPVSGSNRHLGHFIASSVGGASLRYNLDNLRPQCYYCNINLGGNGATFYKNLVEREGQEYVNQIFQDKNKIIKADEVWFRSKITEYELLLQDMQEKNSYNL